MADNWMRKQQTTNTVDLEQAIDSLVHSPPSQLVALFGGNDGYIGFVNGLRGLVAGELPRACIEANAGILTMVTNSIGVSSYT